MLVFFDIDATMVTTGGAGIRAMVEAGRRLFTPTFHAEGLAFAGRLDPVIIGEMLALNGVEVSDENLGALRREYRERLGPVLDSGVGKALPGVMELLDAVEEAPGSCLGVLTGNFEETGRMKLAACGIDPDRFTIAVWGDDSPHRPPLREHLPGVGLERYRVRHGRAVARERVVVIGDTPHDVSCARAHGCRALGVATGSFSVAQLEEAGADLALPNLAETERVMGWLVG